MRSATGGLRSELNDRLVAWRARIRPRDVGLPDLERRRVPGLRREEVAELAGVSTRWYELFETGHCRRVSADFVRRVADALILNERERVVLQRLALPDVAVAIEVYERSCRDGALESYAKLRDFARNVVAASSFLDATVRAVEAIDGVIQPNCATVAILESDQPQALAVGPRSNLVDRTLARTVLDMNGPTRLGATVICEEAPDPAHVVDDARHLMKIRDADGREVVAIHDPAAVPYREYNSRFGQRSGPAVGIFARNVFKGVLSCFWTEPRKHPLLDLDAMEAVCAILELSSSAPYWPSQVRERCHRAASSSISTDLRASGGSSGWGL
jgi:transcriptional regulator with XRE-family HTH domain